MRTVEAPKCTPRVKRIAGIWECRADQISAKAYVDMAATGARTPGVGGAFHRMAVPYIASTDLTLGRSTLKHEGRR
jgi:hypothetical protein